MSEARTPWLRSQLQSILADAEATPLTSPILGWWPFDDATGDTVRYLAGDIDDAKIFDSVLDASEIALLAEGFDDGQHDLDDPTAFFRIVVTHAP